ncbi:MAG: DUF3820 family protein [Nanoarchaeota archaeon]
MSEQNDNEIIMPFGKYKGSLISDVPPSHLLWLNRQEWLRGPVKKYIFDNLSEIMARDAINNNKFDKKYYFKK